MTRCPATTPSLLLFLLAVPACGAFERSSSSSSRVPVRPPSASDPVAYLLGVLPEGECWGLATAPITSTAHTLLEGRLRIQGPEHTSPEDLEWPGRESMLQVSNRRVEPNVLRSRETPLYVLAQEMFMRRGPSLLADVRRIAEPTDHVFPLSTTDAFQVVAVLPDEPRRSPSGRNLEPLTVYASGRDGLVQRVRFLAHERLGPDPGCQRLALRMAATITDGGRTLLERRTVALEAVGPGRALLADLPPGCFATTQTVRGDSTHAIFPVGRLRDQPLDAIAILVDRDASPPAPEEEERTEAPDAVEAPPRPPTRRGARTVTLDAGTPVPAVPPPAPAVGPIIPAGLAWEDTGWGDRAHLPWHRRGSVHLAGLGTVRVRLDLSQPASLQVVESVVRSLRIGPPPPLPACPAGARLPSPAGDAAALAALDEVRTLSAARVVPLGQLAFGAGEMPEWTAFGALLARPEARDAFLHVAATGGTTASRILGLAGLYLTDGPAFDAAYCALRPTLDATVPARGLCREETRETGTLLEAEGAARGDPLWAPAQWETALASSPLDLRGGGLSYRLSHPDAEDEALPQAVWLLSGDGFVPASGAAAPPTARPRWSPDRQSAGRVFLGEDGSVCAVERDGAALCWAEGASGVVRLPSWVRYPREIAWSAGAGCALDAEGRRACFDFSTGWRPLARQRCGDGVAPPDGMPTVRVFEDGPWRHLAGRDGVLYGIAVDGSLHGLALGRFNPPWARPTSYGFGATFPIAVPGVVVAAAQVSGSGVGVTADGSIATWDRFRPPRVIERVPGATSLSVDSGGTWYAHLGDGRVLVTGVRGGDPTRFWSREGERSEAWLEIPALRGARVVAALGRGCALFPGGRVECWGDLGREGDGAPRELPELRGASALSLTATLVCGVMPGPRIRCAGSGLWEQLPGLGDGDTGPRDATIRRVLLPARR